MQIQRKKAWIILISLTVLIKLFSLFPAMVEQYYSRGIYPFIAGFLRLLFGWIPFSVGDILYLVAGIFLTRSVIVILIKVFKKQITKQAFYRSFKTAVLVALWIYVSFNLLWGLNYNRLSMSHRYHLKMDPYTTADVGALVKLLGDSLNMLDSVGIVDTSVLKTNKTIFDGAIASYKAAESIYTDLSYHPGSIKPSLYSYIGNYLGFSGYYNPFSGEAQVNTTVPEFVQPFVACHEIGHQLGYAKENEANFSGFLSARCSTNKTILYSVYFDMYTYARRELYVRDSLQLKALQKQLRPRIKNDFIVLRKFYGKYENPFESLIDKLYARYLVANQQPEGILSYNEVVALLISYYKQEGLLHPLPPLE